MNRLLLNLLFPIRPARESVANAAAPVREADVANSADLPLDEIDGWFKISPFGVFKGRIPGRPQYFGREQAQSVEEEFNSVAGRLGRLFRGIPIYRGHPDVDPEIWPDDRRLGKITKIEVRDDGLWGYAEWNSLGRENKEEEYWIYPSPRWDAPAGRPRFEPDRLISVGLTNTPRIKESEPIFNSDDPENESDEEPTNTTDMDRTALCQKLGLPPESTDEEILAKITALMSAADEAEAKLAQSNSEKAAAEDAVEQEKRLKEEAENSLAAAQAEAITIRQAHDRLLLDSAIKAGRITAAERANYEAALAGEQREQTINSLLSGPKVLNTKRLDLGDRRDERQKTDGLREQVLNSIAEAKSKGRSHTEAWAEAKKNPKFADYFKPAGV